MFLVNYLCFHTHWMVEFDLVLNVFEVLVLDQVVVLVVVDFEVYC